MGGSPDGWIVYVKRGSHWGTEALHGRLYEFLKKRLNMNPREIEAWAKMNPNKILELLREFYKSEGIPFPY